MYRSTGAGTSLADAGPPAPVDGGPAGFSVPPGDLLAAEAGLRLPIQQACDTTGPQTRDSSSGQIRPENYLYAILEVLEGGGPVTALESLVAEARRRGLTGPGLELLERARRLGLSVHAQVECGQQRIGELSTLVDIARELAVPDDLETILQVVTRRTRLLFGMDAAYVSLLDEERGVFEVRAADGHTSPLDTGRGGRVSAPAYQMDTQLTPRWTPDYPADNRSAGDGAIDDLIRAEGLRAVISVPLTDGNRAHGMLYGGHRRVRHFTADERALMVALGDLAGAAIRKVQLLDRSRSTAGELRRRLTAAETAIMELGRTAELIDELNDLVLRGDDLSALAEHLSRRLDAPVAVLNRDGALTVSAGGRLLGDGTGTGTPAVGTTGLNSHRTNGATPHTIHGAPHTTEPHTAVPHSAAPRGTLGGRTAPANAAVAGGAALARCAAVNTSDTGPVQVADGLWAAPVIVDTDQLGTLVLRAHRPLSAAEQALVRGAARTVGMLMRQTNCCDVADGEARVELLDDMLSLPGRPVRQLDRRARRLGVELSQPHVVVVARPEGGVNGRLTIWSSAYARRVNGLRSTRGDCLVFLLPGSAPGQLGDAFREEISAVHGAPVTVGAAGPVGDPEAVAASYRDARRCLETLTALDAVGRSASIDQLGFLGVVLSGGRDIYRFIQGRVGRLLEHDRKHATDLIRTLDAYFDTGGSPTHAAERLHVHPNTVARRLERITKLLGTGWRDPEQALDIQLALRLLRVRHAL